MKSNIKPDQKSKTTNSSFDWKHFNIYYLLIVMVAFVLAGSVILAAANATTTVTVSGGGPRTKTTAAPYAYLSPSSQKIPINTNISVQIWADTRGKNVNAVQTDLIYPLASLKYVSTDTTNSSFTISAQSSGGDGVVKIARGNLTPVSGKLLVATVTFTALVNHGKASVTFANSSALASSDTNTNILASTLAGNYSLTP
jgi:hypothetical protein